MIITAMKLYEIEVSEASKLNRSGSWVLSMIFYLQASKKVKEICVISVFNNKEKRVNKVENIKYVFLPSKGGIFSYDKKLSSLIKEEIDDFKPDIIDIQGIEFYLAKSVLQIETKIPVVATIHGLTSEIFKSYTAGLSLYDLIFNRTLKDILLFDGILERKKMYKKRGKVEIDTLKKLKYVIGRTTWDKYAVLQHNAQLKYFSNNLILRDEFYNNNIGWDINKIEKHSIYVSQSHYPIKGLHILIEAFSKIIERYKDAKLYISGKNMLDKSNIMNRLAFDGYQKIIEKEIKKLGIKNNMFFLGSINANQLIERLNRTHVFILPSFIENSPMSLSEAQFIGTPCIAAMAGGIDSLIDNRHSGLMYNPFDSVRLYGSICELFDDDQFAKRLSENEKKAARLRHNKKNLISQLIKIYDTIISDNTKCINKK